MKSNQWRLFKKAYMYYVWRLSYVNNTEPRHCFKLVLHLQSGTLSNLGHLALPNGGGGGEGGKVDYCICKLMVYLTKVVMSRIVVLFFNFWTCAISDWLCPLQITQLELELKSLNLHRY